MRPQRVWRICLWLVFPIYFQIPVPKRFNAEFFDKQGEHSVARASWIRETGQEPINEQAERLS